MANTVWCALTLIQQSEDEIFTEFLLYRNLVGQWQIKTHNTQKLETTATVQQGCLTTAGWLQQHRNTDHDPSSSLCLSLATNASPSCVQGRNIAGRVNKCKWEKECIVTKEALSGRIRKVSISVCPLGFGKSTLAVISEHCMYEACTQPIDLHLLRAHKSCWDIL